MLEFGCIFNSELRGFVDGVDVGCERKRRVRDDFRGGSLYCFIVFLIFVLVGLSWGDIRFFFR